MAQTPAFFRSNRSGDLITKSSGDVDMIRHFLCWVLPKWVECFSMLGIILVVFVTISPLYTLCLLVLTPVSAVISVKLGKTIRPAYGAAREQMSKLNTVVQENISGNKVVKAFVREDHEFAKFTRENHDYQAKNLYANSIWLTYGPMIESVSSLLSIVNLVMGGIMVMFGNITLGQLNIFLSLAWALNEPMLLIGMVVNDTQRFMASVEKVMGLYYSSNDIKSPENPAVVGDVRGDIVFKNVTLRYGQVTVLDGINLEISAGQTIGFMGPTGGGKTSLVSLIPRFIDATEGAVLLDNVNVEKYALSDLRKNIGLTMQEVFLFSDTVESNIAYGDPDMPMESVYTAARASDADGFIRRMPDGYDTIIGERGTGLSGGQRQRISLARAIAYDSPVLILDDTTSAVDMETERYIQHKLKELPRRATTLIIAQRVSSIKHCDRIYIIEDGKITEQGTHDELMESRGYYYSTYMLQQGEIQSGLTGRQVV